MYVYIYRALLFFTFKVRKMIVPKDMLNIELSSVCDNIQTLISSQIPAVDNIFKKVSTYFDLFPCDLRVLLLKHRDEIIEVHLEI